MMQFQSLLRWLGALVCVLVAVQAIWIFINPPRPLDFWRFCHWLGRALLCIFVGAAGWYMEVKGSAAIFKERLTTFTVNRMCLFGFYLWLGCYLMDLGHYGSWQLWLARITAFFAWAVALGDLLASFCGASVMPAGSAAAVGRGVGAVAGGPVVGNGGAAAVGAPGAAGARGQV